MLALEPSARFVRSAILANLVFITLCVLGAGASAGNPAYVFLLPFAINVVALVCVMIRIRKEQREAQYLSELDRADRDPALVPEERVEHVNEKNAKVRAQTRTRSTKSSLHPSTNKSRSLIPLPKVKTEMSLDVLAYKPEAAGPDHGSSAAQPSDPCELKGSLLSPRGGRILSYHKASTHSGRRRSGMLGRRQSQGRRTKE